MSNNHFKLILFLFSFSILSINLTFAKEMSKYCTRDNECEENESCVYEQICDEHGCTKSLKKICKLSSLPRAAFTRSELIEKYLRDTFEMEDQVKP